MKLNKNRPIVRSKNGVLAALRMLKPNESLTLTTAKEAYTVCGASYVLGKKDGLRVRRRIDGDNLIVWTERIKP